PHDPANVSEEALPNGRRLRYPKARAVAFHMPASITAADGSRAPISVSELQQMVDDYQNSGAPGRFAVIQDRDYSHIVPAARVFNGALQDFRPILSTPVSFFAEARSCNDTL